MTFIQITIRLLLIISCAILGACAQSPKLISADYSQQGSFEQLNCEALTTRQTHVQTGLINLYEKLKVESDNDKVNVAAASFGLLPALFFVSGGHDPEDKAQYSSLLGEYELIQQQIVIKECSL